MIPWDADVPCRKLDPKVADALLFPEISSRVSIRVEEMCGTDKVPGQCKYRLECRAMGVGEEYGIWGGSFAVHINRQLSVVELPQAA